MQPDIIPLIAGLIILASSLISLKLGLSVAIIEILIGSIAGNLGVRAEEWMLYFAGFGGIVLTFLAGAEVDAKLFREKFKESFLIGFFSFLAPFVCAFLFAYFIAGWSLPASLIAGVALSETSIAVVYSVLQETNLSGNPAGNILMAATFVTNTLTALALSIIFIKPTLYTAIFIAVSVGVVFLATAFSHYVFENPRLKNKVVEPEIKYVFFLLLVFIYFANLGQGHAILPAFVLGLFMSRHFSETKGTMAVKKRLRTVAFAFITPLFFIVVGMKVSFALVAASIGLFAAFLLVKQAAKFAGVYFIAKKYVPNAHMCVTLLLSTGLTFGLIAAIFGLNSGFIDDTQYSVLTGVLVASAVLPTFVAQKWYMPRHTEDAVDNEGEGK
ncbi:MAG: cation:proton antiporter [Thermodesulfobacteriota bacterium]